MLLVFTGDGKGKTTAALGQMMRVLGQGKRALMIQFIKGPWKSGEDGFAKRYSLPPERFQIRKMGLGFVGILGDTLPKEEHAAAAQKALAVFREELNRDPETDGWDLIVLDEVNNALALGLLSLADVVAAVKAVPRDRLVVLTGRDAAPEIVELADLITEMREVKHPFQDGKTAKATVEF